MTNAIKLTQTIGVKAYSFFVLLVDIFLLLIKLNIEIFQSIIRLFVKPELKSLNGEIVLITGTGHGIGRELALQYSAQGCKVICCDVNEANNLKTVTDLNKSRSGSAFHFKCDISNREEVLKMASTILSEIGPISVLINNAGIMPCRPLQQHSADDIKKIFDVNVMAHFWTLEAFLPHMVSQKRGHVIALSSIAGVVGLSNIVPYCASKFAVRGMMEALYEEYREDPRQLDIKTTIIYPYMADTGLCKKPKMRFPGILGLQRPEDIAKGIIHAHRSDMRETSIPRALLPLNNFSRTFPMQCAVLLKDFFDSGVESDL